MYYLFAFGRLIAMNVFQYDILFRKKGTDMKRTSVIVLWLLFASSLSAQVLESFADGDFTKDPAWSGDTSQFEVNSARQLHLKSTGEDTSFLVTGNTHILNAEWNFWIKLSFNTSANNYARVYLSSDSPDLEGPLNGYFLQIGGSNDSVSFMKQAGTACFKLFQGERSFTGNSLNVLRVKVTHDSSGTWHLFSDNSGNSEFTEEGSYTESSISVTSWFGLYCRYTSSNAAKVYFDDIYVGSIQVDTIPPGIISAIPVNSNSLSIRFSEPVEKVSAEDPGNYYLSSGGNAVIAKPDSINKEMVHVTFPENFSASLPDTLIIHLIKDLHGNASRELKFPFSAYTEKAFDIVIDEIMADPTPQVGLPDVEYVELYNRTQFPIRLNEWSIESGSTRKNLPDVTIKPYGYLLLSKGNWLNFYGTTIDLFTSSSTLPNDGETLVLRNKEGKIIHSVTYSLEWYQNRLKETGGWSLEMIDPCNPCGCDENWAASTNVLGGTPGRINAISSANPDLERPYMKRASLVDEKTVMILFSEPMDSASLSDPGKWMIDEEMLEIDTLTPLGPNFQSLILHLSGYLEKGNIYRIYPKGEMKDCSGNLLDSIQSVRVAIPDSIIPRDIVINEILPDPYIDGEKFIELYNCSDKILDLRNLVLSSVDTLENVLSGETSITDESFLFFPGDYIILTKDPADIRKHYLTPVPDVSIKLNSLPSFDEEAGIVVIARRNDGYIIDKVKYSAKMHFALLQNTEGVSMERISPLRPSDDAGNWHSASGTCGYATPGYLNSQTMIPGNPEEFITISPELFSPDNDGYNDIMNIHFQPDSPGYIVNIRIYDSGGKLARQLARNAFISPQSDLSWDGIDDNNNKADIGIYIIFLEMVKPDGTVKRFKKSVVLGGKI